MNAPVTLRYEGDGEFRAMSNYWASQCDRAFVIGEMYRITEHYERSAKSHNHFFATIAGAHDTLPDEMRSEFPTAEHLRKKALIRKGYAEHRDHVCATEAAAQRLRAFIEPLDDYAVIEARDCVVRVHKAQSQSRKAMGAKAFQESKQAVLDYIDDLLGVDRGATAKSSGYHIEHDPSDAAAPASDVGRDVDPPTGVAASTNPEAKATDDNAITTAMLRSDGPGVASRPIVGGGTHGANISEGATGGESAATNSEGEIDAGNPADAPSEGGSAEPYLGAAANPSLPGERPAGEVEGNAVASPAADEVAAVSSAKPMATDAIKADMIRVLLRVATDGAVTVQDRLDILDNSRPLWVDKMPGHPTLVKQVFDTAAKIVKGELKPAAAKQFMERLV